MITPTLQGSRWQSRALIPGLPESQPCLCAEPDTSLVPRVGWLLSPLPDSGSSQARPVIQPRSRLAPWWGGRGPSQPQN